MNNTDNRLALSSAALHRVDDFTMSITPPKAGIITLRIHIEAASPRPLCCGRRFAYRVTDIPESSVEPTIRFLDELFPTPISILPLTPAEEQGVECVGMVKHFLNTLYLYLLTGENTDGMLGDYGKRFSKEWYAYSLTKEPCYERIHKSLYHYNQLQSSLIEWYLCASLSYAAEQPQFHWMRAIPKVFTIWDDWGNYSGAKESARVVSTGVVYA